MDTKDDNGRSGWEPEGNWEEAGRGWGARALDWAYLFEPYARPANDLLRLVTSGWATCSSFRSRTASM